MFRDYPHIEKGKEIKFISGFYKVEEEKRIRFGEDEVLVIIGHAVVDTSCCGMGACRYALVPGKIRRWKYKVNENNNEVTEVEPLSPQEKEEFEKILKKSEIITQVIFW